MGHERDTGAWHQQFYEARHYHHITKVSCEIIVQMDSIKEIKSLLRD